MKLIDADKLKMSFKPYFDGKKTIGQIIDEQPTVEAQPNRCDSCTHSEEQDGLNCYECVKGMADNFEAQPTKMRDATEEERKSVKDYIESISKPTGLQFEEELNFIQPHKKIPCTITVGKPSEDCIRREAVINLINHSLCDLKRDGDKQIFVNTINSLPPVTPQEPKTGHWIETSEGTVCSECGKYPYDDGEYHIANWSSAFCPNCGSYNGGGEDADSD